MNVYSSFQEKTMYKFDTKKCVKYLKTKKKSYEIEKLAQVLNSSDISIGSISFTFIDRFEYFSKIEMQYKFKKIK